MPTHYTRCGSDVGKLITKVMNAHHPELREAEPTFNCRFAWNDDGPALKKNGVGCRAIIKITSLRDRSAGIEDVKLDIDGKDWEEMGEPDRLGLIGHELTHLVVVRSKGIIKRDDLDRPKLKSRPHDFEVGAFKEVIETYKEHSPEAQAIQQAAQLVQGIFPWG